MPVRRHPVAVGKDTHRLALVPLNTTLVARLKMTYRRVRAHDLRLAEIFYAKLFAAEPRLRSMFGSDLTSQARKLTAALDAVVDNFESPSANAATLAELGKRHATYGVTARHYDLVIGLLIDSMEEVLDPAADRGALEEWRVALRLISNHMISASEIMPQPPAAMPPKAGHPPEHHS